MKTAFLSTPKEQADALRKGYSKPAPLAAGGPEPIKVGQAPTSAAKPAPQRTGNDEHMTKFMESTERVLKRWAGVAEVPSVPAPAPQSAPKQPAQPLTLEAVRAGAARHQQALRSAKGDQRKAALAEARQFADLVVKFADASEDLDLACDLSFAIGSLAVAADHAEQTALAEL